MAQISEIYEALAECRKCLDFWIPFVRKGSVGLKYLADAKEKIDKVLGPVDVTPIDIDPDQVYLPGRPYKGD